MSARPAPARMEDARMYLPRRDAAEYSKRKTFKSSKSLHPVVQGRVKLRLGLASMQMLVKRTLDYEPRIQSFALGRTPERLVRALLHFAARFGVPGNDGLVRIPSLTHQVNFGICGAPRAKSSRSG
jgi:hypothetical protein